MSYWQNDSGKSSVPLVSVSDHSVQSGQIRSFSGQGAGRHAGNFRLMFTCIPNRRYLRFNRALLAFQLSLVWRAIRPYLDCNQALLATHPQPAVKQGDMEGERTREADRPAASASGRHPHY